MASDTKTRQGNSGAELALDLIGDIRTQLEKVAVRKTPSMKQLWRWGTRFEGGDDA
jgi:hypothetical protein